MSRVRRVELRPAAGATEEPRDGRAVRREQSHLRIVQAIYDLVLDGNSAPTVQDVAARAGVGVRTIFRQFQDLESLSRTLSERVLVEAMCLVTPTRPSGVLAEDVAAFVARRARIYEHLLPFRRAGHLFRHRVSFLREQELQLRAMQRAGLEAAIGPHLGPRSERLLEGLEALLSLDAWQRLRDQQGLDAEEAEQVLVVTTLRLVEGVTPVVPRRRR